jgi:hypothetical protein
LFQFNKKTRLRVKNRDFELITMKYQSWSNKRLELGVLVFQEQLEYQENEAA